MTWPSWSHCTLGGVERKAVREKRCNPGSSDAPNGEGSTVLRNYLLVGLRNLVRNRIYSAISVVGLTVGMVCVILIALYVHGELRFDAFHEHGDRICKVLRVTEMPGTGRSVSQGTSGALGPALVRDLPEVERAVRVRWAFGEVRYGEAEKSRALFCLADEGFLDVFTFPLLRGDPKTALADPSSAVVTERTARRLFGDTDPIGKVVSLSSGKNGGDYTITGVAQNIPTQSSLYFDFLTGNLDEEIQRQGLAFWNREATFLPIKTFALLREGTSAEAVEALLPGLMARHQDAETCSRNTLRLQRLMRMHLFSRRDFGIEGRGDINRVYVAGLVGAVILIIACVNFTNLSTARSLRRAPEIGLRKVVGAQRGQLVAQFLGESVLTAAVSLPLAVVLARSALPTFGEMMGRWLVLDLGDALPYLLALTLGVGVLAGIYPAFYVSAFGPTAIFRRSSSQRPGGNRIRGGLVVLQFSISIVLVVSTLVVYRQLDYLLAKDLGFDRDHFAVVMLGNLRPGMPRYETVKHKLLEHPDVLGAAASHTLPGSWGGEQWVFRPEGQAERRMHMLAVDEDFLQTYSIPLAAGRYFSRDFPSDLTSAVILNETAVEQLGWEDPVGKQFDWVGLEREAKVIGVVEDFHLRSLYEKIGPVAICMWLPKCNKLSLKIRAGTVPTTLEDLKARWQEVIPNRPFGCWFLDESLDRIYLRESKTALMVGRFCGLALFLACLGLFGLASLTAQQRTREIGIRKAVGASVADVVKLLSREFAALVGVANLIAWPVAFLAMDRWLRHFAYRNGLSIWVFLLGGAMALGIGVLTVGLQAVRAAVADPVKSLRYE